jgi:hypothetical protein
MNRTVHVRLYTLALRAEPLSLWTLLCRRLRIMSHATTLRIANNATPPTTPPAMAPPLVSCATGVDVGVGVGEEVVLGRTLLASGIKEGGEVSIMARKA